MGKILSKRIEFIFSQIGTYGYIVFRAIIPRACNRQKSGDAKYKQDSNNNAYASRNYPFASFLVFIKRFFHALNIHKFFWKEEIHGWKF